MIKGRTYYQLLQVDPSADTEVISVVHRKLASATTLTATRATKRADA